VDVLHVFPATCDPMQSPLSPQPQMLLPMQLVP
jgi:hypothetical protein